MRADVMIVAGTRPELIKLAPVFWELRRRGIDYVFVWSGQHYDYEMSRVFIEEFRLPEPDFDLGVGSGSHAVQTAKAMISVEEAIRVYKPSLVIALGDTNTTLAAALASVKSSAPFAHIEAGLRSWNMAMPEEINRIVVDHVSQILFAPSLLSATNLVAEGISHNKVFFTGNTIIDSLIRVLEILQHYNNILEEIERLTSRPYILVTFHRQENVDNSERLTNIVRALVELSKEFKIIIPLHPRTRKRLNEYGLIKILMNHNNIHILRPLGYLEFIYLLKNSYVVLTDSGGVQEEAFTLKVPTVTLRYNTERPETVLAGCNVLAGTDVDKIIEYSLKMIEFRDKIRSRLLKYPNPYGDGKASYRIVDVVSQYLNGNLDTVKISEPDLRDTPYIVYMVKELSKLDYDLDEVIGYIEDNKVLGVNRAQAIAALVRSKIKVLKPWEMLD